MRGLISILLLPFSTLLRVAMQPDKQGHFYWGGFIGFACEPRLGWFALIIVAVIAAMKELWDLFHPPHQCEAWDFVAGVAGGAIAVGINHVYRHGLTF